MTLFATALFALVAGYPVPDDPAAQLLAAQAKVHAVQTCKHHLPAL